MAIRNFTEANLTREVIGRLDGTPDPRLKAVMGKLVKHLHAFVRDANPTWEEWMAGIQFLTRSGQMCDDKRQEFILVSDTLGVSMLVDLLNYGNSRGATESTVLGPFFVEGAPEFPLGGNIARDLKGGELCVVTGSVASGGKRLPGALIEVWQAGADGYYDVQKDEGVNMRGRLRADANGEFWFLCALPAHYPVPTDGPVGGMLKATGRHPMRPPHLHFIIQAPGYKKLVTHLFVKGGKYLESDAVFGVKDSLVVEFKRIASQEQAAKYGVTAPFRKVHYDFLLVPERAAAVSKQPAKKRRSR
jgi:hydroxyquinol 1,2-dioxygenase